QNILEPNILSKMEDWEFSSFSDYTGERNDNLCNRELAIKMLELPNQPGDFYKQAYSLLDPRKIKSFYA
ncbi:MAG TPA: hypothetical protein VE868_02760, partial [Balneolaceae bacterium]|nr:hypothetical protein [Balneolaceae bacterium]